MSMDGKFIGFNQLYNLVWYVHATVRREQCADCEHKLAVFLCLVCVRIVFRVRSRQVRIHMLSCLRE